MTGSKFRSFGLVALLGLVAIISVAQTGSASVISDIPEGVNTALFDGGNLFAAELFLSVSIMVSVGLVLAVLKLNMIGVMVTLIGVMALLVAIGWLDAWVLVVTCLLIAGMFARTIALWITGGSQAGGD